MHTAAIIQAEHTAVAANDNFAFGCVTCVCYGDDEAFVMDRFVSEAGRRFYVVLEVGTDRIRTLSEASLRAA